MNTSKVFPKDEPRNVFSKPTQMHWLMPTVEGVYEGWELQLTILKGARTHTAYFCTAIADTLGSFGKCRIKAWTSALDYLETSTAEFCVIRRINNYDQCLNFE